MPNLVEIGSREVLNVFLLFCSYLPLETSLVLLLNKLVSLLPKIMCGKFFLYWPSGSEEDENVKILQPNVQTTGNQKAQVS